jgi:hypothetical protein
MNAQGVYARPGGRTPTDCYWDSSSGYFRRNSDNEVHELGTRSVASRAAERARHQTQAAPRRRVHESGASKRAKKDAATRAQKNTSTNVPISMELPDATLKARIDECINMSDELKTQRMKEWTKERMAHGLPLPAGASCACWPIRQAARLEGGVAFAAALEEEIKAAAKDQVSNETKLALVRKVAHFSIVRALLREEEYLYSRLCNATAGEAATLIALWAGQSGHGHGTYCSNKRVNAERYDPRLRELSRC